MLIILKSAKMSGKIASMHLFEIQSSKQKSFSFFLKMTKTWNTLEGCFYLSAYGGRQSFFTTNQILMNVLP
jgi:hypothetical protein